MVPVLPDRVGLVRDAAGCAEAVRARFAAQAYDPHRHDDWQVGVTDHGVQAFHCRGPARPSASPAASRDMRRTKSS